MGHVASIVSNLSNARKDFQGNFFSLVLMDSNDIRLSSSEIGCSEDLYVIATCTKQSRRSGYSMVNLQYDREIFSSIGFVSGLIIYG